MKKLAFILAALLVASSFGEEPAPKQRRKNSFYFDATLGTTLRHLGAEQTVHDNSGSSSGCHFESDGRYVCNEKSAGERNGPYEKDIGYTGFGPLFSMRFGTLINGGIAFLANTEIEYTTGKVYGHEKDEDDITPRSIFFGFGPSILFYPFLDSEGAVKNVYVAVTANMTLGSGGDIGFLGGNIMLEAGYFYPVSKRLNFGFAAGADIISPGDLDSDTKNESGFAIWAGVKLIRK